MDIVYPYRKDRRDDLKYSLRSLENIEHDSVFIVGDYEDYFCNIIYIRAEDNYKRNTSNIVSKLLKVCEIERLSDDFILMNDDFFFLEEQEIVNYNMGTLKEHGKMRDYDCYRKTLIKTEKLLRRKLGIRTPISYEPHYPIIINKKEFKRIFNSVNWENENIVWRSVYGNLTKMKSIKAEPISPNKIKDFKFYSKKEFDVIKKNKFISSSNSAQEEFTKFIKKKFKDKSIYEI